VRAGGVILAKSNTDGRGRGAVASGADAARCAELGAALRGAAAADLSGVPVGDGDGGRTGSGGRGRAVHCQNASAAMSTAAIASAIRAPGRAADVIGRGQWMPRNGLN